MWRVSGKCTLFVACAAVITGVAFARSSCSTAELGQLKGREVHIKEQRMIPTVADWKITIPPVCPKAVGLSAVACDEEGAPAIRFTSEKSALVMRSGELKTGAYVYVTVFCDPDVMSPRLLDLLSKPTPQMMNRIPSNHSALHRLPQIQSPHYQLDTLRDDLTTGEIIAEQLSNNSKPQSTFWSEKQSFSMSQSSKYYYPQRRPSSYTDSTPSGWDHDVLNNSQETFDKYVNEKEDNDSGSPKEHQLLPSSLQSLVLPKPPPTQPDILTQPPPTSLLPTEMAETVTSSDIMTSTAPLINERSLWEKIAKWWTDLTHKKFNRRFLRFPERRGLHNVNATRSSIAGS